MSLATDEILKYFTQKQYFPSLATWSFQLEDLYNRFPALKAMIIEGIDLKESTSLNSNTLQTKLFEKIGVSLGVENAGKDNERTIVQHAPEKMNFEGLPMSIINLVKQGIQDKTITEIPFLQTIAQMHYYNEVFKYRIFGFTAEVLIPDAYWHWDWAASIANLCTSFMPIFQRLVKKDLFLFPEIDKPIKEAMYVANSFLTFLQHQSLNTQIEELILTETEPFVGKEILKGDVNTKGGLLVDTGSHVMLGDTLLKTKDDMDITLDMGPEQKQVFWTVAKVYVRPGEVLKANKRLMAITALTIRADQRNFMKLFFDTYRQVGRVRKTAMFLKEAIEEEIRSGGGLGGGGDNEGGGAGAGFKPQTNRFATLDLPTEEIDKTATSLSMDKKDVANISKKIRAARART